MLYLKMLWPLLAWLLVVLTSPPDVLGLAENKTEELFPVEGCPGKVAMAVFPKETLYEGVQPPKTFSKEADGKCKEGMKECGGGCVEPLILATRYVSCGNQCLSKIQKCNGTCSKGYVECGETCIPESPRAMYPCPTAPRGCSPIKFVCIHPDKKLTCADRWKLNCGGYCTSTKEARKRGKDYNSLSQRRSENDADEGDAKDEPSGPPRRGGEDYLDEPRPQRRRRHGKNKIDGPKTQPNRDYADNLRSKQRRGKRLHKVKSRAMPLIKEEGNDYVDDPGPPLPPLLHGSDYRDDSRPPPFRRNDYSDDIIDELWGRGDGGKLKRRWRGNDYALGQGDKFMELMKRRRHKIHKI